MPASNKGEITELAGCDLLTISPGLLGQLQASEEALVKKLDATAAQSLKNRSRLQLWKNLPLALQQYDERRRDA